MAEQVGDDRRVSRRKALLGATAVGVGAGALGFPSVAAAATAPSINVQDSPYLARGDGTTDDTRAIQSAITAAPGGGTIIVPPGVYKLTRALSLEGKRLVGSGLDACTLRQFTAAEAVIEVTSDSIYIADLTLEHSALPTGQSVPNGVGIRLDQVSDRSVIERCRISDNTSGIYCDDPNPEPETRFVFSTSFRDLRIERFTHSGMYLWSQNSGNTGCVLQNIYITNGDHTPPDLLSADFGLSLGRFAQVIAQQINVEWGEYGWPIAINECVTALIESVNIEGCVGLSEQAAFLSVDGLPSTSIQFRAVSVHDCTVTDEQVDNYNLIRLDKGGSVTFEGLYVHGNHRVGTANMRRIYCPGLIAEAAIYFKDFLFEWRDGWVNDFIVVAEDEPPVVRQENDRRLWAKGAIVHGSDRTTPRPPWFESVEWIGSVEPDNADEYDTWVEV